MQYAQYNQALSDAESFGEESLCRYLAYLCQEYSVVINFHDLVGVSKISDRMQEILEPYLYHNNPFCNYLKKFSSTTKACAFNKELLCRRLRRRSAAFYGVCYMGIEELRYPVLWNGRLITCLCVGQFCSDGEAVKNRLSRMAELHQLSYDELADHFRLCTRPLELDIAKFTTQIGILSQYISVLYDGFLRTSAHGGNTSVSAEHHKQNYIVSRTMEYIGDHLSGTLSLKVLAGVCYCSEPYLSAVFKKKTGQTLTGYIQSKRIARSKTLLDLSNLSVTEIAYECGFNDSNYFTRVFGLQEGLSPTGYRNRK